MSIKVRLFCYEDYDSFYNNFILECCNEQGYSNEELLLDDNNDLE
jgi:hypothetical protein